MHIGTASGAEPAPRRGRALIPAGLPRRREAAAGCILAVIVVHLLLAQLTLVLAAGFVVVSRVSRWRLSWLLVPAAAGLACILVAGPGPAFAGFAAGPAVVLRYLSGGDLAGRPGRLFAGLPGWLPRQFPVALVCGSAEAAVTGWLAWLRTDEWAVPPPRPGAVAAVRRALTARRVSAGAVLTRDGCALGVVPSTGAVAGLRWADLAGGLLVTGAEPREVTVTSLQLVHAALRRRKPLIVLAPGRDPSLARALRAACAATGVPLRTGDDIASAEPEPAILGAQGRAGTAAGASGLWGRGASGNQPGARVPVDLDRVVRERSAALVSLGSPELAVRACDGVAALAADLRRIGVDGDGLVWLPDGDRVPADALAALLGDGAAAGLPALVTTTSPDAAADLAGRVGALLVHRVADPALAAALAARTGTRLVPPPGPPAGPPSGAGPTGAAQDLVPAPVIEPRTLLALGPAQFMLTAGPPWSRLVVLGERVAGRLPPRPAPSRRVPPERAGDTA